MPISRSASSTMPMRVGSDSTELSVTSRIKRLRGHPMHGQGRGHLARQPGVEKVDGAGVHSHVQLVPGRPPGGALRQRLPEHVTSELPHQAGALRELDEGRGRQQAPFRMAPAHERLGPDDSPVARSRLGLEEDLDLAARQRAGQLRGQREAFA